MLEKIDAEFNKRIGDYMRANPNWHESDAWINAIMDEYNKACTAYLEAHKAQSYAKSIEAARQKFIIDNATYDELAEYLCPKPQPLPEDI